MTLNIRNTFKSIYISDKPVLRGKPVFILLTLRIELSERFRRLRKIDLYSRRKSDKYEGICIPGMVCYDRSSRSEELNSLQVILKTKSICYRFKVIYSKWRSSNNKREFIPGVVGRIHSLRKRNCRKWHWVKVYPEDRLCR